MFVAVFEGEFGDAGFFEFAEVFGDHAVVLFLGCSRERYGEANVAGKFESDPAVFGCVRCLENLGESIAVRSAQVPWRIAFCRLAGCNTGLHYELEQISKLEILHPLKQRFGEKTIRDVRFRAG
jgi:hypothetical protein